MEVTSHPDKPGVLVVVLGDDEVVSVTTLKKFALGDNPTGKNLYESPGPNISADNFLLWIKWGNSPSVPPLPYRASYLTKRLNSTDIFLSGAKGFHYLEATCPVLFPVLETA